MTQTQTTENSPIAGPSRRFMQIFDTFTFEFVKNMKKLVILILLMGAIFGLTLVTQILRLNEGLELPDSSEDYVKNYLGLIDIVILLITTTLGGSIIATEFEKQTGNLVFPKISRERLLTGRLLGVFIQMAILICLYYSSIGLATLYYYHEIPTDMWLSLGWALLYGSTVLSFVIFLSSFMRSTAVTVVVAFVMMFLGFSIIQGIMSITSQAEPLFSIPYYAYLISSVFNMPETRYMDMTIAISETQSITLRTWITPSIEAGLWGLSIYCALFLIGAFVIFKYRQLTH